ncbi:unnamed protein product [Mucor hiemalis]
MPSEKFRITTNGQSLRNPNNAFFGMTLSANMTLDESDMSAHNDRRSAHNALERQRREHLNVKFQQLAHALPALQTVRRPSKTMIVAKSLEFVSSSLKRENSFLTEIEKLRLENEKLRKQAQNSSQQLKKQVANDEAKAKEDEEDDQTVVEVAPKSNKRKADSQQQLSPPPTPEALRTKTTQEPPKKKRMVKQTKSLQSQVHVIKRERTASAASNDVSTSTPLVASSPWSPLLDETIALNTYPTSSPPNYYGLHQNSNVNYTNATTATTTAPSPIHNDLLFLTPTPIDMYTNMQHAQQQSFHNMINPMLLSPYFVPTNDNNSADGRYFQ